MTKKTLTAKLSPKNLNRLENYADREGISKSEATDRLVKQGLDVEESDMRLVPVQTDGGTIIEDRLDEIEKNQQNQLDKINRKVESLDDERSRLEKMLDQINLWSFGFLFTGTLVLGLTQLGLSSIDYPLAAVFTIISGIIYLASDAFGGSFRQ
jgi:hypothetical protein